jgi:hypothetical protein
MELKTVCAWCLKTIKTEKINCHGTGTIVSHGICASCRAKLEKEMNDATNYDVPEGEGASRAYGVCLLR